MRKLLPLLLVMGLMIATGCSRGPGPEERVRLLFNLLKYADQEGYDAVQAEIYNLLSESSRKLFKERCEELSSALGGEQPLEPYRCLVFQGFTAGRDLQGVEPVEVGETRARLKVSTDGGQALLDFVKEGGEWRLDLVSSLELEKAGYNGG